MEISAEILQRMVLSLEEELKDVKAKLAEAEAKKGDSVLCSVCDHQCNRDKINCTLCKMSNPRGNEPARKKVFLSGPRSSDGTREGRKKRWLKIKEYAAKAYAEGYMPVAPHLYLPNFINLDNPADAKECIAAGLEWLLETAGEGGEFWICSEPEDCKVMRREIDLADAYGMEIKFKYDHPKAARPEAPKNTPQLASAPAKVADKQAPKKRKEDESPKEWVDQKIQQQVDDILQKKCSLEEGIDGLRKLERWAGKAHQKKRLTNPEIGEIRNNVKGHIVSLKQKAA